MAAWNCSTQGRYVEEQVVHMQVALYALFQRLYGMYPCNFVAFLRNQYKEKNVMPIFTHTVKVALIVITFSVLANIFVSAYVRNGKDAPFFNYSIKG